MTTRARLDNRWGCSVGQAFRNFNPPSRFNAHPRPSGASAIPPPGGPCAASPAACPRCADRWRCCYARGLPPRSRCPRLRQRRWFGHGHPARYGLLIYSWCSCVLVYCLVMLRLTAPLIVRLRPATDNPRTHRCTGTPPSSTQAQRSCPNGSHKVSPKKPRRHP